MTSFWITCRTGPGSNEGAEHEDPLLWRGNAVDGIGADVLRKRHDPSCPHPAVPVYDAVIFCDLGLEPPWVNDQMEFTRRACECSGISFYVLDAPLYRDFTENFGERRAVSIPWWTLAEDGRKAKIPRICTIEYKVETISRFVRWDLLGYRKGQRLRAEDVKGHELHMGFSAEEKRRCKENPNRLFVNHFPLVEMGLTRADNYRYILERWGLDTKASACAFCPFHRNYFFQQIKEHAPETYAAVVHVDELLRDKPPKPPMEYDLFISRSRKQLAIVGIAGFQSLDFVGYRDRFPPQKLVSLGSCPAKKYEGGRENGKV